MNILIPMLGCFKDFRCARIILGGIETMHVIAKGQMKSHRRTPLSTPYSNSISWSHKTAHPPAGFVQPCVLIATKPLVRGFEG
jgi:putative transposase